MIPPTRSYSYGPDFTTSLDTASLKKRKRGHEADDSLSSHLTTLSGSQSIFSSAPAAQTQQNVSDSSSVPEAESPPAALKERLFVFSSPAPAIFGTPRKFANPHKRTHFNRQNHATPSSSPIIARTPSLTYSFDSLSQLSQLNSATQACHICQHRPANVQDLSSYIDCEMCRQRTCSICTRNCEGPKCKSSISARQTLFSGATPRTAPDGETLRGKAVCSACCFEVGADGHVWCTACYADDTELENFGAGKTKESLEQESLGRIASWLQDCGPDDMISEEPETNMEMTDWV